jgi:hypothetical protein
LPNVYELGSMNQLKQTVLFVLLSICCKTMAQLTPFEKGDKKVTATYNEIISFYQQLDAKSDKVLMKQIGITDANLPLHLILVSNDKKFAPAQWHQQNKIVILVNNGIHPGEPDGIDASMLLVRDIANGKYKIPNNVCLAIIPVYNIGGCLNRSANFRVDQNGPDEFGFRGNSQNLDLNRDFIKCDSKEARLFTQIFHLADPDIFIDNHVSNGADYQHVMTLIATQHNKLGGAIGNYLHDSMVPQVYRLMKQKKYDLVPYVNFENETPEQGWDEFYDNPRYSSGYTALWNSFGFIPETHMLKSYEQRVDATHQLMQSFITLASFNASTIQQLRKEAKEKNKTASQFDIEWRVDTTQHTNIEFKGFASGHKTSAISGLPRLYYDREQPFTKQIPFWNTYKSTLTITKPTAYIIPQGWWKVIDLLKLNNVTLRQFKADTTINVESYKIISFESSKTPYENHHSNRNVKIEKSNKTVNFRKGDYYIPMNQVANRFLMETLEPQAVDSYFAWNFFDGILGQKEGFSHYVFEETAEQILKETPNLKEKLEAKKAIDEKFAKDGYAQLDFIYRNSKYFEPAYMQYPVYRLMQ